MDDRGGAVDPIRSCGNTSDAKPFYPHRGLFLKPVACLYISVQIPSLKISGQSISTKVLTERIKSWIAPDTFSSLKLVKSTVEFIRFEGEIENKSKLQGVINRLDGKTVSFPNFPDRLKVRASPAKPDFPTRHDWDTFFRDAKTMNEMKPGERPDTLHVTNLPTSWFASRTKPNEPSESVLQRVFEQFGEIRALDIPSIDPYREQMNARISGLTTFSFDNGAVFDAYVQFKDYIAFVKAMDALRGMKLLKKDGDKAYVTHIKVDFDKTKHLSEYSIRKRKIEREKIIAKEAEKEDKKRRQEEEEEIQKQRESEKKVAEDIAKENRRKEREERRKAKALRKLQKQERNIVNKKIAAEERLLLIAQRKLESIRLLSELLERVKGDRDKIVDPKSNNNQLEKLSTKQVEDSKKNEKKNSKISEDSKVKKVKSKDDPKTKSTSKSKSDKKEKPKRSDKHDYSLSDTSEDNCKDYTEPLRLRKSGWHDDRWGPRAGKQGGSTWSSRRNSNHPRNRSNWFGSKTATKSSYPLDNPLYSVTQQLYYKYFQSISKPSQRSRSRSVEEEGGSERLRDRRSGYRKECKNNRSPPPKNNERKTRRSRSRSKENKTAKSRNKMKRTRWGSASDLTAGKSFGEVATATKDKESNSECRSWSRSTSKDRDFSWEQDFV